jgi:hypothetical protein
VTAGHMFDRMFLPRLKSIITLSSVVTSNVCGSHVGLCVALGRPQVIAHQHATGVTAATQEIIDRDFNGVQSEDPWFVEIERAFSEWTDTITPRQQDLVSRCWGLDEHRSREEMRLILAIASEMYESISSEEGSTSCVMWRQIDHERRSGNEKVAAYLQSHLARYSVP